jgi:DNA helicase-2/ATP-dependent DNA helicase PcrA
VTEVVAWLRALETKPGANRWLARILLGPRWRIHYRDLSLLARWATKQDWDFRVKLAGGDEELARDLEPGDIGFSLIEALNHLDEIEHLSDEAKRRLKAFTRQLAAIRKRSNAPLLELVQEIIRQTGILDALDSSSSRSAPAARQNISNFLDQVASFAPVEGEATLRSFISYLDAAEQAEETLEAIQPADQDSVKLMTVHSAKGLEFECVFVPSVASAIGKTGDPVYSIFPNTRSSNPLTSYAELPYDVREDSEHLPTFEGKLPQFLKAVKDRVIEDERRLFYVALTRAKQRLHVSAAHWYGRDKIAKGASPFWTELEALAERDLVEVVTKDECPEENPMFDAMESRREWPPVARSGIEDELFTDGWGTAADGIVGGSVAMDSLLSELNEDRSSAEELIATHQKDLEVIASAVEKELPTEPKIPEIVSATSWVRLEAGDLSTWDIARPLPSRPTSARRLGTEVHRLIEEKSRGMAPYPEEHELDEPSATSDPNVINEMLERFEDQYGKRKLARLPSGEPMVELPFTLKKDGRIIRGRIDAVYETADGGLEIVDFKTGKQFEQTPDGPDQLKLYAEALTSLGVIPEGKLVQLKYAFLSPDKQE